MNSNKLYPGKEKIQWPIPHKIEKAVKKYPISHTRESFFGVGKLPITCGLTVCRSVFFIFQLD